MNLMIVAHPDDECLFGGGQLITVPDWKVICVTNGDHPVRRQEFAQAMEMTKSKYEIWNFYDDLKTPLEEDFLKRDLSKVIQKGWDKIVTHNIDGEYGHLHHMQIHRIVHDLVGSNLWTFQINTLIPLPQDVWNKKVKLVKVYKSQFAICSEHLPNTRNECIWNGRFSVFC